MHSDFQVSDLDAADIVLSGSCNFLMSYDNMKSGFKGRDPISVSVAAVGNWVGGKYALTHTHIHFQMNAMNQRFQTDHTATHILLKDITEFKKGRMLLIAATVDIKATDTLYRFRLAPGKHKTMLAELSKLCPGIDAPY